MSAELRKYTRQGFYQAAKRRIAEARLMMEPKAWLAHTGQDPSKRLWHCDGAVTCALLATECALKATLLHGKSVNSVADLPKKMIDELFRTSQGHSVKRLWDRQEDRIQAMDATGSVSSAIASLGRLDRYLHRYGAQKPTHHVAEPFVKLGADVVQWMHDVLK